MEGSPANHKKIAAEFVDHCIDKFGWRDLSSDLVMDVGCGVEGFCGMAILNKFPDVGSIVGIDMNRATVNQFRAETSTKMRCQIANIEDSGTLKAYEGKMTKVVSTNVFHQLKEIEKAFGNIFNILKPGGEAAVLFMKKSLIDDWFVEMKKTPKWREACQRPVSEEQKGAAHYKEMVEKIGFQVIECKEEYRKVLFPGFQRTKEIWYRLHLRHFSLPSELHEEFKEESIKALLNMSEEDAEGRVYYKEKQLSLLLRKPE